MWRSGFNDRMETFIVENREISLKIVFDSKRRKFGEHTDYIN